MPALALYRLRRRDYEPVWRAMQRYTDSRDGDSEDQLWLVEHPPVFTQGLNGKGEHLLAPGDIPVIPVDRGGQITYHGPGQTVLYLLLDLRRLKIGVRQLVSSMERAVIELLADYDIAAMARQDAPGVYVDGAKIASLGLRVRRGSSYHGLSLNVDMDLEPFSRINPCGYQGLPVTQLKNLSIDLTTEQAGERIAARLAAMLGYSGLATRTEQPTVFEEQAA